MRTRPHSVLLKLTAALCLLGVSAPVNASAGIYGGWVVTESDDSCVVAGDYEGGEKVRLYLIANTQPAIFIGHENWSIEPGREYNLNFDFGGVDRPVKASGVEVTGYSALMIWVDEQFLDYLKRAYSIAVRLDDTPLTVLNLTGSSGAIAAAENCQLRIEQRLAAQSAAEEAEAESQAWQNIPADPFAAIHSSKHDVIARPLGDASRWIVRDDYPTRAFREIRSGAVSVRLDVDYLGSVEKCHVLGSSGHADLDSATCDKLRLRARFEPNLSMRGQFSSYAMTVDWRQFVSD